MGYFVFVYLGDDLPKTIFCRLFWQQYTSINFPLCCSDLEFRLMATVNSPASLGYIVFRPWIQTLIWGYRNFEYLSKYSGKFTIPFRVDYKNIYLNSRWRKLIKASFGESFGIVIKPLIISVWIMKQDNVDNCANIAWGLPIHSSLIFRHCCQGY